MLRIAIETWGRAVMAQEVQYCETISLRDLFHNAARHGVGNSLHASGFTKKWRAPIAGIAVVARLGTTARIAQQSRLESRVVDLAWRCEYAFRRTRMLVTAEAAQRTLHGGIARAEFRVFPAEPVCARNKSEVSAGLVVVLFKTCAH